MDKLGLIAFCGSKGAGKSTAATYLKEIIGVPTEEIAIAGHLKTVCAEVFGVDEINFLDPAKKEVEFEDYIVLDRSQIEQVLKMFYVTNFSYDTHARPHVSKVLRTPRKLLQYIGTEVLHPIDSKIHIKIAMRKKDPGKLTLITDLRFSPEFEYFNERAAAINFVPVYVKNSQAELAALADGHPSEMGLFEFKDRCYLLDNEEKDLRILRARLEKMVNDIYDKN